MLIYLHFIFYWIGDKCCIPPPLPLFNIPCTNGYRLRWCLASHTFWQSISGLNLPIDNWNHVGTTKDSFWIFEKSLFTKNSNLSVRASPTLTWKLWLGFVIWLQRTMMMMIWLERMMMIIAYVGRCAKRGCHPKEPTLETENEAEAARQDPGQDGAQ